jgi:hypothetical protein
MIEVVLSKFSVEMKSVLTWLVENIEHGQWETTETKTINDDLFTVMPRDSKRWAVTVATYQTRNIVVNNPARFTGKFLFKNPKDAMLFKLRWA